MRGSDVNPAHIFILLFAFWAMWLYTEISEHGQRDAFNSEVKTFMTRGGRFTAEDGAALEQRIENLERAVNGRPHNEF